VANKKFLLEVITDNDSGPFSLQKPTIKDGKFRVLLRFRANSGDKNLKKTFMKLSTKCHLLKSDYTKRYNRYMWKLNNKKISHGHKQIWLFYNFM